MDYLIDLKLFKNREYMPKKIEKHPKKNCNNDNDRELDIIWKNWASRRKCEATHKPNFIKEGMEKGPAKYDH